METPAVTTAIPSISPTDSESIGGLEKSTDLMNVSPISQGSDNTLPELTSLEDSIDEDTPLEKKLVEALHRREQLNTQILQVKAQLKARKQDNFPEVDRLPYDKLKSLYDELSEELLQKTVAYDSRQLLLNGEHLSQTLTDVLGSNRTRGTSEGQRELPGLVDAVLNLSSKVSQQKQGIKEMRDRLEYLKKENFDLLKTSRQLYAEIGDKRKDMEEKVKTLTRDEKGKSIHERFQQLFQRDIMQRCLLQILIMGSGVNWAQDEEIQQLMLDCGKNEPV